MAEGGTSAQAGTRPPSRKGLYIPFLVLLVVIGLWSGFWYFTADQAEKVMDNAIAREAGRGRDWRCPNRKLGGYPFRIELSCEKPQLLAGTLDGIRHEASLGGLSLHARLLSPGHFIAVLTPPFRARQGDVGEVELSWKVARASFRAGLEGFADASVEIEDAVAAAGTIQDKSIRSLAKEIAFHLRRSPGEVPGTDMVFRVTDLTFAPLDQITGNPDPMRLEVQASAPGLLLVPNKRFDALLEGWRVGGGKARIIVAKADKGASSIDLAGTLGLDAQRRLEGNLQGRAKGLEALTGNLTRRGGIDVGGLLGRLGGGQGLPVVLSFENGRLRYGPFPLAELRPLY